MRFFRGITVPEDKCDQVIATIKNQGLAVGRNETWQMNFGHPGDLDVLLAKPDLSVSDTRHAGSEAERGTCACGDEAGAAHYAWKHNRTRENIVPIIFEFDVPEDAVAIDGRDFLYTVFQLGEPKLARPALAKAFGERILRYAEPAWATKGQSVAMCDLARHDPEVINAHHANNVVLGGRYGTVFKSAFIVRLPVESASIIRVWSPTECPARPRPEIVFDSLLIESHRRTS